MAVGTAAAGVAVGTVEAGAGEAAAGAGAEAGVPVGAGAGVGRLLQLLLGGAGVPAGVGAALDGVEVLVGAALDGFGFLAGAGPGAKTAFGEQEGGTRPRDPRKRSGMPISTARTSMLAPPGFYDLRQQEPPRRVPTPFHKTPSVR